MTWKRQFTQRQSSLQALRINRTHGLQAMLGRVRTSGMAARVTVGSAIVLAVVTPVMAFAWSNQSEQAHTFIADEGYNTNEFVDPADLKLQVESSSSASGQAGDTSDLQNTSSQTDTATDISLQATVTDDATEVQLNGQDVPMGQHGGTMHKSFESSNGTTTVDISIKNNGGNANSSNIEISNSSSVHINNNASDDDRYDVDARRYR